MAKLSYLVKTLGPTVARLVASPAGTEVEIRAVIIHDAADPFELGAGDLVVAPGITASEDAISFLKELGAPSPAAVMLKEPSADDAEVARAAQEGGVAIISVPRGASWAQIVSLVQSVVTTGAGLAGERRGQPIDDLFALAEAIAVSVGAPITIEDRRSRIIAYSHHQEEADSVRAQTILGRRVPERIVARMDERGIYKRLKQSSEPIYVEPLESDTLPRVAVSVRAGSEELGSIWAAVPGPPTDEQLAALADASRLATLHLLRHRAGADVERKLEADLLATLLDGKAGAADAAHRLGLHEAGLRVLAVAPGGTDAEVEIAADDLRAALAGHLELLHAGRAAALLGGLIYAVIHVEGHSQASTERAAGLASAFLQRMGNRAAGALVGIGGYAETIAELPRSRREAEEALRVLRSAPEKGPVVAIDGVRLAALVQRLQESAAPEATLYDAKIKPLIDSDKTHGTAYVATLRAYLDAFGDLGAAGERLFVHANTVRYRLRRIQELTNIDLSDPDERLGLMLLLRISGSQS